MIKKKYQFKENSIFEVCENCKTPKKKGIKCALCNDIKPIKKEVKK
jgi:hypothetical protein